MSNTPETVADVLGAMKATADNLLAFHKAYPDGGTANDKVACGLARWYMRFNDAYTREIAEYKMAHDADGEIMEHDAKAVDGLKAENANLHSDLDRLFDNHAKWVEAYKQERQALRAEVAKYRKALDNAEDQIRWTIAHIECNELDDATGALYTAGHALAYVCEALGKEE